MWRRAGHRGCPLGPGDSGVCPPSRPCPNFVQLVSLPLSAHLSLVSFPPSPSVALSRVAVHPPPPTHLLCFALSSLSLCLSLTQFLLPPLSSFVCVHLSGSLCPSLPQSHPAVPAWLCSCPVCPSMFCSRPRGSLGPFLHHALCSVPTATGTSLLGLVIWPPWCGVSEALPGLGHRLAWIGALPAGPPLE